MYLITTNTAYFYRSVAALSSSQRYALTALTLIGGLTIWYYGIYQVLNEAIVANERELDRLHQQVIQLADAQKTSKDLAHTIEQLTIELAGKQSKDTLRDVVQKIVEIAAKVGLVFEHYSVQESADKSWYTEHKMRFDFQGKFSAIVSFLSALATSSIGMQWGNCNLVGSSGGYRLSVEVDYAVLCGPKH